MLFNVEIETEDLIRGYFVPDGFSTEPVLAVVADGHQVFHGPCQHVVQGIIDAGRHETGRVGFVLDKTAIAGLAQAEILHIYDAQTGFLIYQRNHPHLYVQRRVFRLETALFSAAPYFTQLQPYFAHALSHIETYGQETVTQAFHLKNYPSMYFEGRFNMKAYQNFLETEIFSIISLLDPYLNLANTIAFLIYADDPMLDAIDIRELRALAPALQYFTGCNPQAGSFARTIRRAPKPVLQALTSPLTGLLANNTPGDIVVAQTALPKALETLSQFSVILRAQTHQTAQAQIAQELALGDFELPQMEFTPEILALRDLLRGCSNIELALESDLLIFELLDRYDP